MEKIQMPCTEEQFDRDLKPFLVDAGVDISSCKAFEQLLFIKTPYHNFKIGTGFESSNWETIDYKPKEFLKHLGIDIYDVGDVVKIGDNIYSLMKNNAGYYLDYEFVTILQSTLYDLNKTIQFLKSHKNKMKEKPFTLEQAKDMLAIESLKELAFQYYPELKSPVNTINEGLLDQLSYGMFGKIGVMAVAESAAKNINRPDLYGKSLLVCGDYDVFLHKTNLGNTIIEFKTK